MLCLGLPAGEMLMLGYVTTETQSCLHFTHQCIEKIAIAGEACRSTEISIWTKCTVVKTEIIMLTPQSNLEKHLCKFLHPVMHLPHYVPHHEFRFAALFAIFIWKKNLFKRKQFFFTCESRQDFLTCLYFYFLPVCKDISHCAHSSLVIPMNLG